MTTTKHVYPTDHCPSALDLVSPGIVVLEPIPECWLCKRGDCLQTKAEGVVVHSPRRPLEPCFSCGEIVADGDQPCPGLDYGCCRSEAQINRDPPIEGTP